MHFLTLVLAVRKRDHAPSAHRSHPGTQRGVARILSRGDRGPRAAAAVLSLCPQRCARAAVSRALRTGRCERRQRSLRALRSRGSRQGSPNPRWALTVIPAPRRGLWPYAPTRHPPPRCRSAPPAPRYPRALGCLQPAGAAHASQHLMVFCAAFKAKGRGRLSGTGLGSARARHRAWHCAPLAWSAADPPDKQQ